MGWWSFAKKLVMAPVARVYDTGYRTFYLVTGALNLTDGLNYDISETGRQVPNMGGLEPGDVMLKQGFFTTLSGIAIDTYQVLLNRSNHIYVWAGLLGHAAIYVGNGEIAEANDRDGCKVNPLGTGENRDYNWYVIRCNDPKIAERIADRAKQTAKSGKVKYNQPGLVSAVLGETVIDAFVPDQTARDRDKLEKGGTTTMFCSEFAVFCLNCAADEQKVERYLEKPQYVITPEELYVKLRENKRWHYVGELHKGVR